MNVAVRSLGWSASSVIGYACWAAMAVLAVVAGTTLIASASDWDAGMYALAEREAAPITDVQSSVNCSRPIEVGRRLIGRDFVAMTDAGRAACEAAEAQAKSDVAPHWEAATVQERRDCMHARDARMPMTALLECLETSASKG